ncbi:S-adenosylmethionine:tRNA ribosyltransferase-isomerase [Candidatus Saccharibacteria bacterium]|nr:S-adenosylmethionine:tRNA ribosyltransferase-isomerase [Candidatus Saccharibacteria bacterium]MCB9821479.1 S-adenosylmethionine:tRNA ribosyltransferase-isomerase [Candidatus Nomurabacteria bacterium]
MTHRYGIEFEVPPALIAQQPVSPRDSAKLLVYRRADKTITDDYFYNLDKYLVPETTLVVNNSKVEQCRWLFPKQSALVSLPTSRASSTADFSGISASGPCESRGAVPNVRLTNNSRSFDGTASSPNSSEINDVEIFVLEKLDNRRIVAMVKPGRKFKLGKKLVLADGIEATVTAINDDGHRTLEFNLDHDSPMLKQYEHVPLPPYIAQNDSLEAEYQTVYAKQLGSKAAPTAGLHFTDKLLAKIRNSHAYAEVDLKVGLGTFAPLTEVQYKAGALHAESFEVSAENSHIITGAKHITAVGTTSLRTLESLPNRQPVSGQGFSGKTNIFIKPGYEFMNVDSLITNFHLPGTSLLLLVEAFVGSANELLRIYQHALKKQYRFYSFGDAMLII